MKIFFETRLTGKEMLSLCLVKNFLTKQEITLLEVRHRQCKEKRSADRIKTILSINEGYDFQTLATILRLDDSTLRNYYSEYMEGGIENLLEDHYSGAKCRLSCKQLQSLDQHLQQHIYSSSKEIKAYIKKTYGVVYTVEGVKNLLYRMGYTYKKLKHIPGKADRAKQEAFLSEHKKLKKNKQTEDRIYFTDTVHVMHNSIAAYRWIKKGTEKKLKANTGR